MPRCLLKEMSESEQTIPVQRIFSSIHNKMADWNNCAVLDERLLNELQDLEAFYQSSSSLSTIDKISTDILILETQTVENNSSNDIDQVVRSAEGECFKFLEEIDNALQLLSTLGVSYTDVTSRTNTLMRSCEDLLDQQQQLQTTIDSLQEFLIPFNDIEDISNVLGIPADSRGTQAQAHLTSDLLSLDPRIVPYFPSNRNGWLLATSGHDDEACSQLIALCSRDATIYCL